jgi:hypothetical protein
MSFKTDIEGALDELQGEIASTANPATFTWRDTVEVPCVPGLAMRASIVSPGGHEAVIQFALNVKFSEFRSVDSTIITVDSELYTMDEDRPHPVMGRHLIYNGKTYKILSAGRDASGAYYKLELGDKNSGR